MKAKTLLTVAISLSALAGFSQAREVETTMGKEKGRALRIEVNEPASKVEKAMQTQLSQTGVKPTKGKGKGLYQYKGVKLSPSMNDSLNIYTRVESKGKDKSVVYFAAARSNGEFITEEADSSLANQVRSYLYDFIGTNNLTSLDYDIYQVSDSVGMDEANGSKYDNERKKLEKQRDEISKQLTEMESTSNQHKADAERRKQRMQELQGRKGTNGGPVSSTQQNNSGAVNQSSTNMSSTANSANAKENQTSSVNASNMNKSQKGTKTKSATKPTKSDSTRTSSVPDSTQKQ